MFFCVQPKLRGSALSRCWDYPSSFECGAAGFAELGPAGESDRRVSERTCRQHDTQKELKQRKTSSTIKSQEMVGNTSKILNYL